MFQLWMQVCNRRVARRYGRNYNRAQNFFASRKMTLGGDYELYVYIAGKLDYASLPVAAEQFMIQDQKRHGGWKGIWSRSSTTTPLVRWRFRQTSENSFGNPYWYHIQHLHEILALFQIGSCKAEACPDLVRKLFPRRERVQAPLVGDALSLYDDGSFVFVACETQRFYYIFLFCTS